MSERKDALLQPVRGTHDLIGEVYRKHQRIRQVSGKIARTYGYEPIATPLIEYTSVFKRNLGESTDIIGKEMYTFLDRGNEEISLRPEGTAGVVRAILSNRLTQSLPLKLIYKGPMMRYERPQKGRTRQFHHVGVEYLGIADPLADVETIALGAHILRELGLLNRLTLEINTIGDKVSRQAFREALITYFTPLFDQLSKDSQERLRRNPLRILDSKDDQDKKYIADAPALDDFLTPASQARFEKVCRGLESLEIPYKRNSLLVRGLDYYCDTTFEFTSIELGAQSAVLAGGRYDSLVAQMGGPETPAIGWGLGIERAVLLLNELPPQPRPLAIIPVGEDAKDYAFAVAMDLRTHGLTVEFIYAANIAKAMKQANKVNARAAILIGLNEIQASQATVRHMDTRVENPVAFGHLKDYLETTFKPFE